MMSIAKAAAKATRLLAKKFGSKVWGYANKIYELVKKHWGIIVIWLLEQNWDAIVDFLARHLGF